MLRHVRQEPRMSGQFSGPVVVGNPKGTVKADKFWVLGHCFGRGEKVGKPGMDKSALEAILDVERCIYLESVARWCNLVKLGRYLVVVSVTVLDWSVMLK